MSRPTAVILTSRLPWPLDDGGRIATWQNVRAASRAYDTTLISLVPPGEESTTLPRVFAERGVRVLRVPHRPPSGWRPAWDGLFGPLPYTLARYRNAELPGVLCAVVGEIKPSFVMVTPLHMATYADDLGGAPMILRELNLEHVWMKRYAQRLGLRPQGLYARTQVGRLQAIEAKLARRAALVLAIQEEEAKELRALAPAARVEVLPVGVDLASYREPHPSEPPVVLLAGSFAWAPNVDGAIRFLREGWPIVRAQVRGAKLRVVGKDPPEALRRVAETMGADVVANVASMAEELAKATVFVVPLWVGAGVRVKIVEAMAARVPVVATRLAAEGLGIKAEEDYAAADTPGELGNQVARLLAEPELRATFRDRGRAIAEERWSQDAVAERQNALCAGAAR